MKQILLKTTFIFLVFTINVFSIHCQSANWQPVMREVVIKYKDSVVRANILIKHEQIKPSDNLIYYWYKHEAINKNIGGFAGELLHGPYSVYNNERKLITQGNFDTGLMTGEWKCWNDAGNLRISLEYKNGLLNGEVKIYNNDGALIDSKKYKAGEEQLETGGIMKIWKSTEKNNEKHDPSEVPDSTIYEGPAD